jgi:hypothetical protein
MDTRIIKIAIALGALAYTVYLFWTSHWGSGIGMIFVTAILGVLIFRSIRLIIVFFRLRQQKMDKAKIWLLRINPDKLWKSQQGYWHYLNGSVEVNNNLSEAEKSFKKALKLGLRMDHDKAAAKLNLAVVALSKNRQREGKNLLNEAKKLDTKGMLKKDIKMIEKAMKNPKVIRQRR